MCTDIEAGKMKQHLYIYIYALNDVCNYGESSFATHISSQWSLMSAGVHVLPDRDELFVSTWTKSSLDLLIMISIFTIAISKTVESVGHVGIPCENKSPEACPRNDDEAE